MATLSKNDKLKQLEAIRDLLSCDPYDDNPVDEVEALVKENKQLKADLKKCQETTKKSTKTTKANQSK